MSIVLGMALTVGKSDIVKGYKVKSGATIPAGRFVHLNTDGEVEVADTSKLNVIGIAGYTRNGVCAVFKQAIEMGAVLASGTPAIGGIVYITSAGLLTATAESNTALNARFSSIKDATSINAETGASSTADAVLVDFAFGL